MSARLGELFDRHHQRLFRLALRLGESEEGARDLVQESFLRAARRLHALPADDQAAEAWLVKVVVNLVRDGRRRTRVRTAASAHLAREDGAGESHEERVIAGQSISQALDALPPKRRACVVLRELEELEVREIARLLGVAPVTVRWNLAAARKDLARLLAPLQRTPR